MPVANPAEGRCGPADRLGETIEPSATADRILRAEDFGRHFENRLYIVVKASHQFLIDAYEFLNLPKAQNSFKMTFRIHRQKIPQIRGRFPESSDLLRLLNLKCVKCFF